MEETKRQRNESLRLKLKEEREPFILDWKKLGDFILPQRFREYASDVNRGIHGRGKIINSTASLAARTLSAGFQAGITSRSQEWLGMTLADRALAQYRPVKIWLEMISEIMLGMFARSNVYNVLPLLYGDMGTFATGVVLVEEDYNTVIRMYSLPVGSYMLSNDEKLRTRIFFREFRMTVRQIVGKFGSNSINRDIDWSKISTRVKDLWDNGKYEEWIDVCHFVKSNEEYDQRKWESKYKKFKSVYYEKNCSVWDDSEKCLREKGYDYFPILAARWETTGSDAYGSSCPGIICLGDNMSMQLKAKHIDKANIHKVNPSMMGPESLRRSSPSIIPGDITFVDIRQGMTGFQPTHNVNFDTVGTQASMKEQEEMINEAYYKNLFLMLSETKRSDSTAYEISKIYEEKLGMLGAPLGRIEEEVLDNLIDIVFYFGMQQGVFPEPPEEIQGEKIEVVYTGILAKAQKLAGIERQERFMNNTIGWAANAGKPEMLDKINFDEQTDIYGDKLGVKARIINSDETVMMIRENRAQIQQQAAEVEQIQQGADILVSGAKAEKSFAEAAAKGKNAE